MDEVNVVKFFMALGSMACFEGIIRTIRCIDRIQKRTAAIKDEIRRLER